MDLHVFPIPNIYIIYNIYFIYIKLKLIYDHFPSV